jgi:hypothetical protein
MATTTNTDVNTARGSRRLTTETRPAAKTTELMAYIAAVLAVAITALLVGDGGDGGADPFSAEQALGYITFLTIGYMIARGLAKSGTRGSNNDHDA